MPVEYAGHFTRHDEPLVRTFSHLVEDAQRQLGAGSADRVFFGHSLSALIAYELAARVPAPLGLVVSGRLPAPAAATSSRSADPAAVLAELKKMSAAERLLLSDHH